MVCDRLFSLVIMPRAQLPECEYYKEQFDLRKYNMKQIWRNLNQTGSLSTTKENKGITELSDNGKNIIDNLLISNVLNKYFATVGENLSKKLQNSLPNSFISFYCISRIHQV